MTDARDPRDNPVSDEMSEYLQMFLDETEEQLEELVEALLVLEREPHSVDELNESFRLIHSIKGSAGMMGFDSIAALTHHLENRFEAFRSGIQSLDKPTMNLVLRCIDFLRECTRRLRGGDPPASASELLQELTRADEGDAPGSVTAESAPVPAAAPTPGMLETGAPETSPTETDPDPEVDSESSALDHHDDGPMRVSVEFEPGLPLADLKARLILSRLSTIGEIRSTTPDVSTLDDHGTLARFGIMLATEHDAEAIRRAISLDGVANVDIEAPGAGTDTDAGTNTVKGADTGTNTVTGADTDTGTNTVTGAGTGAGTGTDTDTATDTGTDTSTDTDTDTGTGTGTGSVAKPAPRAESGLAGERSRPRVAETMRVDIDRLDRLMNLAGELVVNRARFVQINGQLGSSFMTRNTASRVREFSETLRRTIDQLRNANGSAGDWAVTVRELEAGLGLLEEQSERWAGGRKCFTQVGEAIDQLTRISDSLQQGVLDTRMVPIAPLFNRFNRVVRDLAVERDKKVDLRLRGEKTELDKRMIDELGDPLVHLVRNSIDHGLEPAGVRRARGKAELGTITLEASHSGNNVLVSIGDDGGGIDVARVRRKIVERGLLSSAATEALPDPEVLDYIWHAGFSTADQVTDISGRGVGMDVVRTRIADLNGTVEIESVPEVGTTFTIRLPLTLAIINSLLVRVRSTVFSIPIDGVREIVSVPGAEIVDVRGTQSIDVRGQYLPLISIDHVFDWNAPDAESAEPRAAAPSRDGWNGTSVAAVILQAGGRTMGLRVDQLLGSQDIVIKSLAENFVEIRGLSGASILGDGTVCLMLDVATFIDMAFAGSSPRCAHGGSELDHAR